MYNTQKKAIYTKCSVLWYLKVHKTRNVTSSSAVTLIHPCCHIGVGAA